MNTMMTSLTETRMRCKRRVSCGRDTSSQSGDDRIQSSRDLEEPAKLHLFDPFDVILGRGETAKRQNQHYRILVRCFAGAYNASTNRDLKRLLAMEVFKIVKCRGGRFLKIQYRESESHVTVIELSQDAAMRKTMKAMKDTKKGGRERCWSSSFETTTEESSEQKYAQGGEALPGSSRALVLEDSDDDLEFCVSAEEQELLDASADSLPPDDFHPLARTFLEPNTV